MTSDLERDIHATAEDLTADAKRLGELEEAKSLLDPDDPTARALAEEALALARLMVPKAALELDMIIEAASDGRQANPERDRHGEAHSPNQRGSK